MGRRGGYDWCVLYFTSDHHFGHANIIEYCRRPFRDVDAMREFFVAKWNEQVEPTDQVWVLGDFALGRLDETLKVLDELNGRKFLVPGNHDRCFPGHKKARRERQRYLDAGFEDIFDEPVEMAIADQTVQTVQISHFPYRNTGVLDEHTVRYADHRPVDRGGWLLHGHVHERWRIRNRQINVGVDAWAGQPVPLAQIASIIRANPKDRDVDAWPIGAGMTEEAFAQQLASTRAIMQRQLKAMGMPMMGGS